MFLRTYTISSTPFAYSSWDKFPSINALTGFIHFYPATWEAPVYKALKGAFSLGCTKTLFLNFQTTLHYCYSYYLLLYFADWTVRFLVFGQSHPVFLIVTNYSISNTIIILLTWLQTFSFFQKN